MGYGHDRIGFTLASRPPTPTPLASAPPSRVRIPTTTTTSSVNKPPLLPSPNPPDNPHIPVAAAAVAVVVVAVASASAAKETRHQSRDFQRWRRLRCRRSMRPSPSATKIWSNVTMCSKRGSCTAMKLLTNTTEIFSPFSMRRRA